MKDGNLRDDVNHLSAASVAAYTSGECTAELRQEVEDHCVNCTECREQLAVVLQVCRSEINAQEQQELSPLVALGLEAATKARQMILARPAQAKGDQAPGHTASAPGKRTRWRSASWPHRSQRWAYFPPAVVVTAGAIVLAALGTLGYLTLRKTTPASEPGMAALRLAFRQSRRIEARITGGFAHHPYEVQRGATEAAEKDMGVDQTQLLLAQSQLLNVVSTQPSVASRHALGRLYLLRSDFDKAEAEFTAALKDAPRDAALQADLAALYYEQSQRTDQLTLLIKASDSIKTATDLDPKLAEAWFTRALCDEKQGLHNDAKKSWEEYLKLDPNSAWAEEARDRLKKLPIKRESAKAFNLRIQEELSAAVAARDQPALRRLVKDELPAVRQASDQLFDDYLAASIGGEEASAAKHLQALQQIAQLTSQIHGDRFLLDAVNLAARGDQQYKQQLKAIRGLLRQGDADLSHSHFDAAREAFTAAQREAARLNDFCHLEQADYSLARYHTISLANNPSGVSDLQAASNEALALKQKLVAETDRQRHRQLQARALIALGNTFGVALHNSAALEANLKAEKIAREIGDREVLINALRTIGSNYARLGDYDRAIRKNYEAIASLAEHPISDLMSGHAYRQMGVTLSQAEHYQAALAYHQEARRHYEQAANEVSVAGEIGRLAVLYGLIEKDEEAERYANDAIPRINSIKDSTANMLVTQDFYSALGELYYRQRKFDASVAAYQQAITTISQTTNQAYLPKLYQGLAITYLAQGKDANAQAALETSIKLTEESRKQIYNALGRSTFLSSRRNVYHTMTDFQFTRRQDYVSAFNWTEISKSRDLLDSLNGANKFNLSDGRLTLALDHSAEPLTLEAVQRALPANAQLLAYAVTEQRLLIWLVTRDRMTHASSQVSAAALRGKVADYLAGIKARRDLAQLNEQAAELYTLLISPVAAQLDRQRILCVIPDETLNYLPFVALVAPGSRRYMIEDFSMVTNASASVFVHLLQLAQTKPPRASQTFLGLSAPASSSQALLDLPKLRFADQEIAQAKEFYQKPVVLSRGEATESALARQMGQYDVVHLATHTFTDQQKPLFSSILLADEPGHASTDATPGQVVFDGQLHAYEIAQQKLERTRLMILSSCRSGVNQGHSEAVSGLAQAFLVAGVPSVIASLWDIDDESAAELMAAFHRHHRAQAQSFSVSLQQTQLSFIRHAASRRQHPYYWAAFLLLGNGLTQ